MQIDYFVPTRVIVGKDGIRQNAEAIAGFGQSALVVTGGRSAKLCGAFDDVTGTLDKNGQKWTLFDKVTPNPDKEQAQSGALLARQAQADFIIAIGGGSPIDAGKAISHYESEKALPILAVPTTAGTGSEVTPYAILTDHEQQTKTSIASAELFPKIAFLDARYTMTVGAQTTVNTAVDALSHAIEGLLTVKSNPLTDVIAREAIHIISGILFDEKTLSALDYDKREKLLCASMLAGMVIANTGTTTLHALGYSLTYFKGIEHGKANGLLMARFLERFARSEPEMIAEILGLMGMGSTNELGGLMTRLLGKYADIEIDEIKMFAGIAIKAKNIQNTAVVFAQDELEEVYTALIQ